MKEVLGTFGSHVYNGGVNGKITVETQDGFCNYEMSIGVSNFAAVSETSITLQDPKMVDEMIFVLQRLRHHMIINKDKVAVYI